MSSVRCDLYVGRCGADRHLLLNIHVPDMCQRRLRIRGSLSMFMTSFPTRGKRSHLGRPINGGKECTEVSAPEDLVSVTILGLPGV